jgi:isovaleryl-CoA dehydrogenase
MPDTLVVYAKTGEGSKGITTFIIEKDMPGFSIGRRSEDGHARLARRRARVQRMRSAGRECDGSGQRRRRRADERLDYERTVLAGIQLGIMQACMDWVLPYIRDRKQFGKPIGGFQLMQAKIADMYVALNSARAYVYTVAKNCDAGKTTRFDAAGAILLASENAVKVSLEAIQALGGAATPRTGRSNASCATQIARHRRRHQRDPRHADRAAS